VLESGVLGKICGPKWWELTANCRWLYSKERRDYSPHKMLVTWTYEGGCDGWGMWHVRAEDKCVQGLWLKPWRKGSAWKTQTEMERINLNMSWRRRVGIWIGIMWLRSGISGVLLLARMCQQANLSDSRRNVRFSVTSFLLTVGWFGLVGWLVSWFVS
jgi:hypothetical protein